MSRLSLLWRGAWSRKGFSVALFALGVITMAAAAIGPLYARAARESILTDTLSSAPAGQTGVSYSFRTDVAGSGSISAALRTARGPAVPKGFAAPIMAVDAHGLIVYGEVSGQQIRASADLAWLPGACAHLVVIGRCPTRPGEVLVSQRTLDSSFGWHRGGTFRVVSPLVTDARAAVTIVGSYRPKDVADRFWFGGSYFDAHQDPSGVDVVDAMFTTQPTLESMPSPTNATVSADYPVQIRSVHLNDVQRIRAQVAALTRRYPGDNPAIGTSELQFRSGIAGVLAAAKHDGETAWVASMVVSLQLAALAWLVLFQVMADAIEARGSEIALAKLRGLRPMDTLRFGLGEHLLLMAAAIPVSLLLALGVVHLLAGHLLASGAPVVMSWVPLWAVLAGFTGGCVAALLAARRVLTRRVLDQWRRTGPPPPSRGAALALDLAVVAAAIGGLIELRWGHPRSRPSAFGLGAPGLLVLAAALLGIRVLGLASRGLVAATDGSRHLGIFLAARQVARRPAALRLAAIAAATVGLASFALAGEAVASANREQRAEIEVGAPRVLSVQTAPGHDPVQATHDADPRGQWAMAAARWLPDGGQVVGTVLAVDAARLSATMNRAGALPDPGLLRRVLTSGTLPQLSITGDAVRIHLDTTEMSATEAPTIQFGLDLPGGSSVRVAAEPLRRGRAVYTAAVPCGSRPCTLTSITWDRGLDTFRANSATMLITAIEQRRASVGWRPVPARLSNPAAWRGNRDNAYSATGLHASAAGLRVHFTNSEGESASIEYADFPRPAVAIATPAATAVATPGEGQGPSVMSNNQGASVSYRLARRVPLLPAVLDDGLLIDLRPLVGGALPGFSSEAQWEVWLGPDAPPDAVTQLQRHGLLVQSEHTTAQRRTVLGRQGPALALKALLSCGIAAAILGLAATATAAAASGRRRSFELAALRVLGVRNRALLRGLFLEQAMLLGAAVIIGVPAGGVAAWLTMSAVPEYSDTSPVPMTDTVHPASITLFAITMVVLLAATALTAALALIRAAVPNRLREAEV